MIWTLSERLTALAVLGYLGLGEGAALYALANGSGLSVLLGLSSSPPPTAQPPANPLKLPQAATRSPPVSW
jgi:hypothetical protein